MEKEMNMTPEQAISNLTLQLSELIEGISNGRILADEVKRDNVVGSILREHIQSTIEFERQRIAMFLERFGSSMFTPEEIFRLKLNEKSVEEVTCWFGYAAEKIIYGKYMEILSDWGVDPTPWHKALDGESINNKL